VQFPGVRSADSDELDLNFVAMIPFLSECVERLADKKWHVMCPDWGYRR